MKIIIIKSYKMQFPSLLRRFKNINYILYIYYCNSSGYNRAFDVLLNSPRCKFMTEHKVGKCILRGASFYGWECIWKWIFVENQKPCTVTYKCHLDISNWSAHQYERMRTVGIGLFAIAHFRWLQVFHDKRIQLKMCIDSHTHTMCPSIDGHQYTINIYIYIHFWT